MMFDAKITRCNLFRSILIVPLLLFVVASAFGQEKKSDGTDIPVKYEDSNITQAVEADLAIARGLKNKSIDIETEDGIVTLRGKATNILAKDRAERIAKSIKGVRSVVNTIKVQVDRSDSAVAKDIKAALAEDPATDDWEISTTVKNNVVTLTGEVDSWQEKQLAATVVKGVKGVKNINNKITVNYITEPTDSEIKENVSNALKWDSRVDDLLIDISVPNDKVTLTGSVGSAYEKELATNIANTSGVKKVNAGGLKIKPWARDKMKRREGLLDLTAEQKEDAILDAFAQDPRVSSFEINVEVEDGVATLSGTVDNLKAKKAAARDAQNTMGVWMVDKEVSLKNKIVVTPSENLSDSTLKQNVSRSIIRDPYIELADIDISADDGAITLMGEVDSYFEKLQAGEVASTAAGVERITNNISVEDYDPFAFDRLLYDWDPIADDVDFMIVDRTGAELKEEVVSQITWSPYITMEDIDISVNSGVVTLTGQVDSSFEYNEATEEAYEAGALKVKNELTYNVE